jgi:hypothetical protein
MISAIRASPRWTPSKKQEMDRIYTINKIKAASNPWNPVNPVNPAQ